MTLLATSTQTTALGHTASLKYHDGDGFPVLLLIGNRDSEHQCFGTIQNLLGRGFEVTSLHYLAKGDTPVCDKKALLTEALQLLRNKPAVISCSENSLTAVLTLGENQAHLASTLILVDAVFPKHSNQASKKASTNLLIPVLAMTSNNMARDTLSTLSTLACITHLDNLLLHPRPTNAKGGYKDFIPEITAFLDRRVALGQPT